MKGIQLENIDYIIANLRLTIYVYTQDGKPYLKKKDDEMIDKDKRNTKKK